MSAPMSLPVNTKRRGRPPGQTLPVAVQLRLSVDQMKAVDAWIASQPPVKRLSRSEAIRVLVEAALKADFVGIDPDGQVTLGQVKSSKRSGSSENVNTYVRA